VKGVRCLCMRVRVRVRVFVHGHEKIPVIAWGLDETLLLTR
jgi:hypothetical protein